MVPGPPGPPWRTWGTDAFLLAQRTRRPVLLVLFDAWSPAWVDLASRIAETATTRDALAARAVLVTVDRDERPDLADRYAPGDAPVAVALDMAGWPLAWADPMPVGALETLLRRAEALLAGEPGDARAKAMDGASAAATRANPVPGDDAVPDAKHWTDRRDAVARSFDTALDAAFGNAARDAAAARRFFRSLQGIHGWVPDALIAGIAPAGSRDGPWWMPPLLEWATNGPLWDDHAGACRRGVGEHVADVRMADDNARWLLAWSVAARAGHEEIRDRLVRLAAWMARQVTDRPAPGLRPWDAAPPGRAIDVGATLRGARAWMHVSEVLDNEAQLAQAVDLFDTVAAAALRQGAGLAHLLAPVPIMRGLLGTQIVGAAAALDAAAVSGREAYVDLADELLRNAVAKLWRDETGLFVDRVASSAGAGDVGLLGEPRAPYEANLEAASVMARLAERRRDQRLLERARVVTSVLGPTALAAGVGAANWLAAARDIDRATLVVGPAEPR
jgi:hypothetical protein